ncbi:MAG: hypothetical protein WBJ84_06715 [Bacteroidales bacterium]
MKNTSNNTYLHLKYQSEEVNITNSTQNGKSEFILMTSLYNETDSSRVDELLYCLKTNLLNSYIKQVVILYDTSRDNNDLKIFNSIQSLKNVSLIKVPERPAFSDFFKIANNNFKNNNVIIANSDIYFDNSLYKIDFNRFTNLFIVLSRYNDDGSHKNPKLITNLKGLPNFLSADAWIFRSPINKLFYCDYKVGTMYSDSFLNAQLIKELPAVINPCLDIFAFHLQKDISESQSTDEAQINKFKAIYSAEQKRTGISEISVGLHWTFFPSTHKELDYNLNAMWSKKNYLIDLTKRKAEDSIKLIGTLNSFSIENKICIWLMIEDFKSWAKIVFQFRNNYLNLTFPIEYDKFSIPNSAQEIEKFININDDIYFNNDLINPLLNIIGNKTYSIKK